ncbi:MAG: cytochrome d ubiquinol oxidase subunit II [Archangiaceae bacterium]|nr:cytochrome d ubiquinol oxidase subunit II [Archangiaceae bacterium]
MATLLAAVMLGALLLYALLAGADFGGGVWDLLARGPRAKAQRDAVSHALAPVWEANHVWLILMVVVLFTAFPPAFAAILTALHVPLTLMLVGIVLRGSAFVFRQYGGGGEGAEAAWGRVFAVASGVTPVFLGAALGAMTTGGAWHAPFPLAVGFFALALFAMLAAVYLTHECQDAELQSDFRLRALGAAAVSAVLALVTALLAPVPVVSWPAAGCSVALGAGLLLTLLLRRFAVARAFAIALVTLVVAGWGLHRYPVLLPPGLTVENAAAPPQTLRLLEPTLGLGALVLFPSLYWLMRVFKRRDR